MVIKLLKNFMVVFPLKIKNYKHNYTISKKDKLIFLDAPFPSQNFCALKNMLQVARQTLI